MMGVRYQKMKAIYMRAELNIGCMHAGILNTAWLSKVKVKQ